MDGATPIERVTALLDLDVATITPNAIAQAIWSRDYVDGDFTVTTAPAGDDTGSSTSAVASAIIGQFDAWCAGASALTCAQADETIAAYRAAGRDDLADQFYDAHVLGDDADTADHDDAAHLARKAELAP